MRNTIAWVCIAGMTPNVLGVITNTFLQSVETGDLKPGTWVLLIVATAAVFWPSKKVKA